MNHLNLTAPTINQLVDHVKSRALAPGWYNKGWDVVVECLTDDEIAALIGPRVLTFDGATRAVYQKYVKPHQAQAESVDFGI